MAKKRKDKQKEYVDHPRYGNKPMYSGNEFSREEIEASFWAYSGKHYFPESAIVANIEKQSDATFPRTIYVDIEQKCVGCGRCFIFFALEQKYWYEELKFYIDADCVKCVACRKQNREIKEIIQSYEILLKKEDKTDAEIRTLKDVSLELFQQGYIKNQYKIDRIK